MPSDRRTRAMGYSPGGPKALDINAPTRQPRKGKSTTDAPEPLARTTRARAGAKRNSEDVAENEPPAKKTRRMKAAQHPDAVAPTSQELVVIPDSGSDDLPESTSLPQESIPVIQPEYSSGPRINAQQPTPPLDTPVNATPPHNIVNADEINTQSQKSERRISDMINSYRSRRPEEQREEKALSECDDDEWEERYSAVMEQARNPTPFIPKSNNSWEKITPGSATMNDGTPQIQAPAAENQGGHCMTPSSSNTYSATVASLLAALGARPITRIDTIVAISASLDWYENNPAAVAPTAVEMRAMLDDFARAKQASKSPKRNPTPTKYLQSPTPTTPLTPKVQLIGDKWGESLASAESDDDRSNFDDQEEQGIEQYGDLDTNMTLSRTGSSDRYTSPRNQQPSTPRSWASALSASTIGNVLLTPVNWFTRRNRDRQNISATEPRPIRTKPDLRRLSNSHQKPRYQQQSAQAGNKFSTKKVSSHNLGTSPLPPSPTPLAPQARRGRPDSHLPVHLRGVRYEDLPSEWQDVSQHLKKPTTHQPEDEDKENDDEPVDMEKLFAIAKRTREERAVKEREEKELKEQAEHFTQQQDNIGSKSNSPADHMKRAGKKRVTFAPKKIYSAKLGHSTYGMPLNIDDSSSEGEEEVEFLEPRIHFGRNSKPVKSCLKRPYQQPTSEESHEAHEKDDGYRFLPPKKARTAGFVPSDKTDDSMDWTDSIGNGDDPHRAQPSSNFISKPPSETRMAEAAQKEFERLNPPATILSLGSPQTARTSFSPTKSSGSSNVFTIGGRGHTRISPLKSTLSNTVTRDQGSPIREDRVPEDKTGHAAASTGPLIETRNERLNKQREDVLKHKPKISSSLQITQISSPPHDNTPQRKEELTQNPEKASELPAEPLNSQEQTTSVPEEPAETQKEPTQIAEPLKSQDRTTSVPEEPAETQNEPTQIYKEVRWEDIITDEEVRRAIALIPDEEIVPAKINIEITNGETMFEASVISAVEKAFHNSS